MLIVTSITKAFNGIKVLDGVNLTVEPGSARVVIGPSGAGKSTLLRCVGLLEPADSGSVCIDGKEYAASRAADERDSPWPNLTLVFQQHFLWPHLTLSENITLPLERRLPPSDIRQRLCELVDLFDMGDFIGRYPNEASLGERQRVALARAFALKPRYILLDEVTSSLDVEQVEKLLRHLLVLLDSGIGVVAVTHLLGFATALLRNNDRSQVHFLDEGRVTACGGRELLQAPPPGRIGEFLARMQFAT